MLNLAIGCFFLTDPNDPAYSELIYFVKNFEQAEDVKYFRLEQLQQEFDFCTPEDIAGNRRFQVLQLRERQVTDFAHLRMVPSCEEEIPASMLADYKKRMRQEASSILNSGNSKRQQYSRMLQKVNQRRQYQPTNTLGQAPSSRIPTTPPLISPNHTPKIYHKTCKKL